MSENMSIMQERERKVYFKPILFFIGAFLLELFFQVILTLIIDQSNPYAFVISWMGGKLAPLIFLVIVLRKTFKENARKVKKAPLNFVIFLVASFIFIYLVQSGTSYISAVLDKLFGTGESTNQSSIVDLFRNNQHILNYILLFITIVLIAPVLEELEYRYLIFDAFKGSHWTVGLIVSGIAFGLIHMSSLIDLKEWAYFPMYALPGVALGLVYHFSGNNYYTNIFCHLGNNLISFIQILYIVNQATPTTDLVGMI
ncbi:MAG: CPBP family intramembrane metalloprotease [Gammaproteobacteria bacterium]|nr:CPBP family intramembrane metalloprotease [Gammaproteobacteria bacterium]